MMRIRRSHLLLWMSYSSELPGGGGGRGARAARIQELSITSNASKKTSLEPIAPFESKRLS